ncbi:MAG: hypothetical protein K2O35_04305, partial [Clostridia bacterium]|nr:hypothetical protein [Clostridia bacterium]
MYFSKQKRIISIVICIIVIMALACSVFIGSIGKQSTQAVVINNADTIATDLLMDKATRGTTVTSSVFNGNALSELYEKLAGKGADFNAVANKARTKKSTFSETSVKSMHAGMDSGQIRTANGGRNVVVKLDGKEWTVVALSTKDTSSTSDVILTLMLKDVAYNSKWGDWYPTNSDKDWSMKYPATMYSTSYIRAGLLNGAVNYSTSNGTTTTTLTTTEKNKLYATGLGTGSYPFSIYTDTNETGHITDFLVKPNEVLYQQYENLRAIATTAGNDWYQTQNENSKYDVASDQWHSNGTIAVQGKTNYYDWGNDLIWLPSLSETGQNGNNGTGTKVSGGLWNLDTNQRGVSTGYITWLRSGDMYTAQFSGYLDAAGSFYFATASATDGATNVSSVQSGSLAVRPALHLNLSSAAKSAVTLLDDPSDVSIEYDGTSQNFASGSNPPTWYTESFKAAVTARTILVKTLDKTNTQVYDTADADTYSVEFTINDPTGKIKWKNYASNASATRKITFEITAKPIGFTTTGEGGSDPPTVTHNPADLVQADINSPQGSILDFHYDNNPLDTPYYSADKVLPTVQGNYIATVISVNPNYTPDPNNSMSNKVNFSVAVQNLTVPTVATASMPYTGADVRFTLNDFDPDTMEILTSSLPTGVTFDGLRTITATKANKYTIKVALKNKQGSVFWNSGIRNDVADKEIKFEITPYKISVQVDTDNNSGKIKVSANSKVTLTALIAGLPLGSDAVNMLFSAEDAPYKYSLDYNDLGSTTTVSTGYPVTSQTMSVNIELHTDSLSQGQWDLIFKSDNTDYEFDVTPANIKLDVVGPVQTIDPMWLLMRNGARIDVVNAKFGDATPINYGKMLTYNDRNTYEFRILAPGLTQDTSYGAGGYKIVPGNLSNTKLGKNADTYTTSVQLTDSEGNSTIYSITWTIDPVKFDLSGVKWQYDGQLPYNKVNGSEAILDPKTLP